MNAEAQVFFCEVETRGSEETLRLASSLAPLFAVSDLVLLAGDLGAGKTMFVKGVAAGLRIDEAVTSPTFTLAQQYGVSGDGLAGGSSSVSRICHIDLYRLNDPVEILDYLYEELDEAAVFVEWGLPLAERFPDSRLEISIGFGAQPHERVVAFRGFGARWERVWEQFEAVAVAAARGGAEVRRS